MIANWAVEECIQFIIPRQMWVKSGQKYKPLLRKIAQNYPLTRSDPK